MAVNTNPLSLMCAVLQTASRSDHGLQCVTPAHNICGSDDDIKWRPHLRKGCKRTYEDEMHPGSDHLQICHYVELYKISSREDRMQRRLAPPCLKYLNLRYSARPHVLYVYCEHKVSEMNVTGFE